MAEGHSNAYLALHEQGYTLADSQQELIPFQRLVILEGLRKQQEEAEAEKLKIAEAFMPETGLTNFKLIYRMSVSDYKGIEQLKEQLEKAIAQEKYAFTVSVDVYNALENLVVVHGLTSKLGSRGLSDFMANPNNGFNVTTPSVAIATENYKIIQVYKSLDDYEKEML